MSGEDLWIGFGGHPDLTAPHARGAPGATPLFPLDDACDSAPLASHFLVAVTWSAGPGGPRREGYFIDPSPIRRYAWVLWGFGYAADRDTWSWRARAATSFALKWPADAAQYLLAKTWDWEHQHHGTHRYDRIDEAGILDEPDIVAIADRVWLE